MTRNARPGEFTIQDKDTAKFKELTASARDGTKNMAAGRKAKKITEAVGVDKVYSKWNGKAKAPIEDLEFETMQVVDTEPRKLEGLDEKAVYDKWNSQTKAKKD